jgi:hypothetical protein
MSDQSSNRPLTSKAVTYKTLGSFEVIAPATVSVEMQTASSKPLPRFHQSLLLQ